MLQQKKLNLSSRVAGAYTEVANYQAGAIMKSQIWDLVPNGTKVQIWSQKSPNFACKSQISDPEV